MIRSALLLCAGIIVAACLACTPGPAPVALTSAHTRTASGHGIGTGSNCTAGNFATAVMLLPAGNQPSGGSFPQGSNYSTVDPSSTMWADLENAWTAAPKKFQDKLCQSDIFIDQTACASGPSCFGVNSWSFRNPGDTSQRYLALSQSLWPHSASSPYSYYETSLIAQTLQGISAPWPDPTTAPKFSTAMNGSTSVDTPGMMILAALAHEYGHIIWYDRIKINGGKSTVYDPTIFCRKDPSKPGDGFFDDSWNYFSQPNNWQEFAYNTGDTHLSGLAQTSQLIGYLTNVHPDLTSAANYLNNLYTLDSASNANGIWPSLYGTISPEEDFAEAFKIYILTDKNTNGGLPVTSMPLNLYSISSPPDLYADIAGLGKQKLKKKMACVDKNW